MANKNAPAHDFAPAWLKIPSYDTHKPSGANGERGGHTSRRDEHSYGFARHSKESEPLTVHSQYFPDSRRERDTLSGERKPSYLPSYHHSLDFGDSHSANSVHNNIVDNFSVTPSNSQSSLLRRPHSRHDFRNIPTSYSKGDAASRSANNCSSNYYGGKGKLHDTCSNSNNSIVDVRKMGVTSNNFNQEFPSLQGDITEEPVTPPPTLNGGAWEQPRNMKIHSGVIGKKIQLVKKPIRVDSGSDSSRKSPSAPPPSGLSIANSSGISNPHTVIVTPIAKGGSTVYRALVPAKNTLFKKPCKDGVKVLPKKSSTTPPPSAHSMEILVKHPKAPGNKSEFLKALRNENKGLEEEEDIKEDCGKNAVSNKDEVILKKEKEESNVNGIDIAKLAIQDDKEKPVLSSSWEAEQRLLREMGWKEECSDDDNYAPLTEDEVREFRDLTEKYSLKNGFRRSLQVNFSPRRLVPFTKVPSPTVSSSSSSDSDSDY